MIAVLFGYYYYDEFDLVKSSITVEEELSDEMEITYGEELVSGSSKGVNSMRVPFIEESHLQ